MTLDEWTSHMYPESWILKWRIKQLKKNKNRKLKHVYMRN